MDIPTSQHLRFKSVRIPHELTVLYCGATLFYASWWLDFNHVGSWILYGGLLLAEVYHVWQALGYLYTVWSIESIIFREAKETPLVDVFITVCGEPREIVEQTVVAALRIDYPNFTVHILNDGLVAHKENWREVENLKNIYPINVITRTIPGGAKAGNINHALTKTSAPFLVLFDADHIPHRDFLKRTIGYFENPKMAFVQTPQYYINKNENSITRAAWEQQELFFGPICQGKNRMNATFWCGTNAVMRREALLSISGVPEQSIAEDFLASLFLHERGWKSIYIPEVLAHGLAPVDLENYISQQYRWARGSLDVMFRYNPLFRTRLSFAQKMQYLYSAGFYLNGFVVLIDALVPLIFLFFGVVPVIDTTGSFIVYFAPFIFLTLYFLMKSTGFSITFRAVQLTIATSFVYLIAMVNAITGRNAKFKVTSKQKQGKGNLLKYATPNIIYIVLAISGTMLAFIRDGLTPAVATNVSWAFFNTVFFWPFIYEAYSWNLTFIRAKAFVLTKLHSINFHRKSELFIE